MNLEEEPSFRDLFKRSLNPASILKELNALTGFSFENDSLLFIDEIQACPEALTSLRYFYEKMPQQKVIAAGSLLDFVLEEISFPVGRIQSLYMFPMCFSEFLGAVKGKDFRNRFEVLDFLQPVPTLVHEELNYLLNLYFRIGGMPKVVNRYIESGALPDVAKEQRGILADYLDDINKYSKRISWEALQTVFLKLPSTTLRSNINLSKLGEGLRAEKVKAALRLFELAHLINRINSSNARRPPLEGMLDEGRFRYSYLDIGLLQSSLGYDWSKFSSKDDLLEVYEGVLAEQFVAQELLCSQDPFSRPRLFYWDRSARGAEAEVDFLLQGNNKIYPIEVKNSAKGRLKSLHMYMQEYGSKQGIILCQRNVEVQDNLKWVPLYAAGKLYEMLGSQFAI